MTEGAPAGAALRFYCALGALAAPAAPLVLRARLARGREDPDRWREKLARTGAVRPEGRLAWLHGVGIGEVMALRGLVGAMAQLDGGLSFLVTSMSRTSLAPLSRNMPPRAVHQFLPLDAPPFVSRFLDHWRPDLAVWTDQEVWPCFVRAAHGRGIPQAWVSARVSASSHERRSRAKGLHADMLSRLSLVAPSSDASARRLEDLGAAGPLEPCGPLKAAGPPLADLPEVREGFRAAAGDRLVWLAASTHEADEPVALDAHAEVRKRDGSALLVVVPRDPKRGRSVVGECRKRGLAASLRSESMPGEGDAVFVADSFGEMGAWMREARVTLVGGTFGETGGHNPWEPALLGSGVVYGPSVHNFTQDFAEFDRAGAAARVSDAAQLASAVTDPEAERMRKDAAKLAERVAAEAARVAERLVGMVRD